MKIKIIKNIVLIGIVITSILSVSSCKKFVDNGAPINALTEDKAFVDSATATSVVLALYSNASNQSPASNTPMFNIAKLASMSADEGYYLLDNSYDTYKNNTLSTPPSGDLIWFNVYSLIGKANSALKDLPTATISQTTKNRLIGETKFWRAYCYFYLVNFYGDVPLVTTTDALQTALYPRTPTAQVYKQIVADLLDAEGLLTTTYPSIERARVNQSAVSAFLARVYFYQQNWAAAEQEATKVISSGIYSLEPNTNNVFLKTSNETIWQIANTTGVTSMGSSYIPASTSPTFVLYNVLAQTFEAGDLRKANWTKSISYLGTTYLYPYKYKIRTGTTGNEYPIMLRLSEQYLIRSEARVQQNNILGAQADLNIVRARAGLAPTIAATQASILAALEHERWVELFTEWGDRWFNLKRTGHATAVLSPIKPAYQPFQQLYPLTTNDLVANKNLVQNPGY
jgi:hypothetical protein